MNKECLSTIHYEFIIIPYRDQYFIDQYGWTVRDLMIIKALSESERIDKITAVNRPVSIYERLITKRKRKNISYGKIEFMDKTSFDLIGPLQKRGWTEYCYKDSIKRIVEKRPASSKKLIILDFTPIAKIDYNLFKNAIIWYDLIDNFIKHNRFSKKQKQLVQEKYVSVEKNASIITGVTSAALDQFKIENKLAITNGLLSHSGKPSETPPAFAFGFVGFITDKLDVEFLIQLANKSGERIAIFGHAFDKNIALILKKTPNIQLFGKFNESQLPQIMEKFEIGLIPYQLKKSHDGSPIKLYQYFNHGLPVITTQKFEDRLIQNKYVKFVTPDDTASALQFLQDIRIEREKNFSLFQKEVKNQMDDSILWSSKINMVLNKLDILQSSRGRVKSND